LLLLALVLEGPLLRSAELLGDGLALMLRTGVQARWPDCGGVDSGEAAAALCLLQEVGCMKRGSPDPDAVVAVVGFLSLVLVDGATMLASSLPLLVSEKAGRLLSRQ
jgi:hypothetical protein